MLVTRKFFGSVFWKIKSREIQQKISQRLTEIHKVSVETRSLHNNFLHTYEMSPRPRFTALDTRFYVAETHALKNLKPQLSERSPDDQTGPRREFCYS